MCGDWHSPFAQLRFEERYVIARTMKRSVICLVLPCLAGCAAGGKMVGGEATLDKAFPSGYSCTNYSCPYVRAAYGIVIGKLDLTAGTDIHTLIGPPERECDPDNAEIKQFAQRADTNKDRILTYRETLAALEAMRGTAEP